MQNDRPRIDPPQLTSLRALRVATTRAHIHAPCEFCSADDSVAHFFVPVLAPSIA